MRTTIRLDDELFAGIKRLSVKENRTVSSVIEDALYEMLIRRREAQERPAARLTTVSGGGLQPGVDLGASAVLCTFMEGFANPD